MKLRKFAVVTTVIMITLLSCDRGWGLLINDSEKVTFNFNDSKVEVYVHTMGGIIHWVIMDYYLRTDITIHPDVVNVKYEDKAIEYLLVTKDGKEINEKNNKLNGSGTLYLEFSIPEAEPGDTIKITAPDFITYNSETLSPGELIIVVGNKIENKD
jgi:hypothetical protein